MGFFSPRSPQNTPIRPQVKLIYHPGPDEYVTSYHNVLKKTYLESQTSSAVLLTASLWTALNLCSTILDNQTEATQHSK
jgi:hypothetical protein